MTAGTRRVKSVEDSIKDTDHPEHRLKKHLSALDLTVFGVGVIIGTGIFVLTGEVAKTTAGPAVAISFVIAGVVCGLAALCYAEFASTVPVAGSAYTFSYATLGEFVAWIIGWDLVLELALGAATVSVGWSGYLNQLLGDLGIPLPTSIAGEEATVNIPAIFIAAADDRRADPRHQVLVTGHLGDRGDQGRDRAAGDRRRRLLREGRELHAVRAAGGGGGIGQRVDGAAHPDPLRLHAEHVRGRRHPRRGGDRLLRVHRVRHRGDGGRGDQEPRARHARAGSSVPLAVCTALYVAVSLVVVGMQHYTELSTEAPLADAFRSVGLPFLSGAISVGALAGLTSVVMILLLGQSRVLFAMSRDRLLPPALAKVHPKYGTPYAITLDHRRHRRAARRLRAAEHAGRAGQHRHAVRVRAGVARR